MKFKVLATAAAVSMVLSGCVFHIDANNRGEQVGSAQVSQQKTTSVKAAKQSSNKVFSQNYVLEELENGLKVMVVKTDYPDVVSLQIPVSVGSRDEVEAGKTGFAHFFEPFFVIKFCSVFQVWMSCNQSSACVSYKRLFNFWICNYFRRIMCIDFELGSSQK